MANGESVTNPKEVLVSQLRTVRKWAEDHEGDEVEIVAKKSGRKTILKVSGSVLSRVELGFAITSGCTIEQAMRIGKFDDSTKVLPSVRAACKLFLRAGCPKTSLPAIGAKKGPKGTPVSIVVKENDNLFRSLGLI